MFSETSLQSRDNEIIPLIGTLALWGQYPVSQKMEQNPPSLSIQEGGKAMLICNYTNYSPAFIQWYRQDPGRGLVFLLLIRENEHEKQTGRLSTTFDTRVKQTAFHIAASQPADSATYFCAADTQ
uniref:Ig-like domain-containing protein n=1 Tax=Sus scrofa TaxID=9823 RepID=A0A8D0U898_PIG